MRPTTLTRGRKVPMKRVLRTIPRSEWEALKPEIDELYREERWTQDDLLKYLNTEKNFKVNKRQLIYRLGKWGFFVYGTHTRHGDEDMADMQEDAGSLTTHLLRALSSPTKIAGPPSSLSNAGYSTLQSCIIWTTEQLETLSNMPIVCTELGGEENPLLDTWREDTELFLTLWNRWQTSHWNQLDWIEEAEPKLGVSATELLAIVSGMVLDVSSKAYDGDDDYGDDDGREDQEQLLDHARESVRAIGGLDNEGLWKVFSETLDRRNTFLSDEAGRPSSMIQALDCIGKFGAGILAEGTGV